MSDVFEVRVPLDWIGLPWTAGSFPSWWLARDGGRVPTPEGEEAVWPETKPPPEALTLRFRAMLNGRDEMKIQRKIDELNGGLRETVDLDMTRAKLWAALVAKYEAQLWPDGRPTARNRTEAAEQDRAINRLFAFEGEDRVALERLIELCDRQRTFAEWAEAIVAPPPGWERLEDRAMPMDTMHAILRAYAAAKGAAESEAGKATRSGP